MNKKIIFVAFMFVLVLNSFVNANMNFIAGAEINNIIYVKQYDTIDLVQLESNRDLDTDFSDGETTYLFCMYEIYDDDKLIAFKKLHEMKSNLCPDPALAYSFDETGLFTYKSKIIYVHTTYNYNTGESYSESGLDNELKQDYYVKASPKP
ncbi:MAG: hypothetical protein ACTSPQ_18390, partial [Candidatus Helarchaeota archaeon]